MQDLNSGDIIPFVLIQLETGKRIWVPLKEYRTNPERGSFEVRDDHTNYADKDRRPGVLATG